MRTPVFFVIALVVGAAIYIFAHFFRSDYLFFAGYVVLQFVVLATAWNILGGYCGYVNFGSAAFFALGAYSTVTLHKIGLGIDRLVPETIAPVLHAIFPLPFRSYHRRRRGLPHRRIGNGLLTLRLRGAFLCHRNAGARRRIADPHRQWDYVGGLARRLRHPARERAAHRHYIEYLSC